MRVSALILAIGLASAALAQEPAEAAREPKVHDYSRPTLLRLLEDQRREEQRLQRVRFVIGAVEFRALGTRWRFNYLPLMAPLSGTQVRVSQQWPDPFLLTGTALATTPRNWRERREVEKELKRIGKAKVRVTTGSGD